MLVVALYNYDGSVNVITQVRLASGENVVKVRKKKEEKMERKMGGLKKIMKQKGWYREESGGNNKDNHKRESLRMKVLMGSHVVGGLQERER